MKLNEGFDWRPSQFSVARRAISAVPSKQVLRNGWTNMRQKPRLRNGCATNCMKEDNERVVLLGECSEQSSGGSSRK
jgi:hypothetical protein